MIGLNGLGDRFNGYKIPANTLAGDASTPKVRTGVLK